MARRLLLSMVFVSACSGAQPRATPEAMRALQGSEAVTFEALQALLPTVPAWTRGEMTGVVLSEPVRGTQASLTLSRGDARMTIEIVDTVFNQALYAPVAAYLDEGFTASTDARHTRAVRIHNQPAFEEFTTEDQRATVTVLVGKRFLVHVQTTGVPDTTSARNAAESIDMAKLAGLK